MTEFISGYNVIASGVLVFQHDQTASVRPFSDDAEYEIEFRPRLITDGQTKTSFSAGGPKKFVIDIAWNVHASGSGIAPSAPILVAELDNGASANMNVTLSVVGSPSRYTVLINYSIYSVRPTNG